MRSRVRPSTTAALFFCWLQVEKSVLFFCGLQVERSLLQPAPRHTGSWSNADAFLHIPCQWTRSWAGRGGWTGGDALQHLRCQYASPTDWLPIRQKDNDIQYTELHPSWVRLSLNTWSWTTFHGTLCSFFSPTPVQSALNMWQSRLYAKCWLTFLLWLHSRQDVSCTLWTPASCK